MDWTNSAWATRCSPRYFANSAAPIQRVELYYIIGTDWLGVGSTFSFGVFGVHSDGVYEKVPWRDVTWQSSNPRVIEVLDQLFGTLRAVSPGTAVITATYQGLSDSVTQEIRSGQPAFPYLNIQPYAAPSEELRTAQARALWHESSPSFLDVTTQATWASSNTLVATVNAGLVTAQGVGTVRITATYQGYSKSYVFSVSTSVRR